MASWHDAYRGVIPDEILKGRTVEGSLSAWQSSFEKYPDNIGVGETGDALLAGFCCAGPIVDAEKNAPFEFEIYGLHVAPSMRRRGIGAALLTWRAGRFELPEVAYGWRDLRVTT